MSYSPINVDAYVAAFAGALAGMGVSDWISNPNQANYATVSAIAGAFAEAFDIAWNSATALTSYEVESIGEVCTAEFIKHPPILSSTTYQVSVSWTVPALACVALVLEGGIYLTSQGITPSPSGSIPDPLSHVFYVDGGTTNTVQNGSESYPFDNFVDAYTAASTKITDTGGATIMVVPGVYDFDVPSLLNGKLSIVGMNGAVYNDGSSTSTAVIVGSLTIEGVAGQLQIENIQVSVLSSTAPIGTIVTASGCFFSNTIDLPGHDVTIRNSIIIPNTGLDCRNLTITNCIGLGFGPITPTGTLTWDSASERSILQAGNFLPAGAATNIISLGPDGRAKAAADLVQSSAPATDSRFIVMPNTMTNLSTFNVDSTTDNFNHTIVVDIYTQSFDYEIDDLSASTLLVVPAGTQRRVVLNRPSGELQVYTVLYTTDLAPN